MSKEEHGSLFPVNNPRNEYIPGMSIRDYFAAHATEEDIKEILWNAELKISRFQAKYIYADAMLEAGRGAS